jgi:hypothetical protein
MKIKLFYSYSHEDETDRDELEKHLTTLKDNGLIDEWHDRKINAGDKWEEKISEEMDKANIILLLFSTNFIASTFCQKEVEKTLTLGEEKGTTFIPIILKTCAWKEVKGMSVIQALPRDAQPVNSWDDKDEAWLSVYEGIKEQVEEISQKITPVLKIEFKDGLLKNPITDCTLDKLFVYPDILELNKSEQKLESNEIDSEKLTEITSFKHKYILIEGKEQSGKTSLCNMLYLHYVNTDFYPILVNGKSITGKADIRNIVNEAYQKQYQSTQKYWRLDKPKIILIIDNINERTANNSNYANFIQSIQNDFEYAIILIDESSNLFDKSTEHNYFHSFNDYVIKSLGHKKRDELIRKCIANDENTEFSLDNTEHTAKLDKDTKHINTIIGTNIVPSYPVFIVSVFNIVESVTPQDMHETSYGHCYHAMITTQLYRTNIKPSDMDQYFNLLTELAYFMFNKNKKYISKDELEQFSTAYQEKYYFDKNTINNLIKSNSLIERNEKYSFQYIYIYYYFVAKYIADHINDKDVKEQINQLLTNIHKKDNSNIVVFITHHTRNNALLDDILLNTMSTFENFSEATLEKAEVKFIDDAINSLRKLQIPPQKHNVETTRDEILEERDESQPTTNQKEEDLENSEDDLLIEIRKSAKNMEIIGQIMKNQYGTFEKDKLRKLFEEGQNAGLRLLKSFMDLMNENPRDFEDYIHERILQKVKEESLELSQDKIRLLSQQFATGLSYDIIFGWLYKIVDSLGYDKLIGIADDVNNKTGTIASKLINFSIHAWHKKDLDSRLLTQLYEEFKREKNYTAVYVLRDIVSRHIYMHKIGYRKKQKIDNLLKFSVKKQVSIQSKIK